VARITPQRIIRRAVKYSLYALAAFLLAGSIAPFISADSYGRHIQSLLEASLGRKVSIGKVHFTLFSGPGFSIEDVTIGEDPRYGIEPCAYVPVLETRLRLDKLLAGRIQFAELRLEGADGIEPTLNLVKRSDGTWNVVDLVTLLGRGRGRWTFLPALQIEDARLNFKFGQRKSSFYVDDADVAAYPEASGKVRIRFSGTPSRADRSGHGFSSFEGEANWYLQPSAANPNQLEAAVSLERSNLSEITSLIGGYDIGIHGSISSHLRISGPAEALRVRGNLSLEDVHRWDLIPSSGENWNVRFGGLVDLAHNRIQLQTIPADEQKPTPMVLEVRVNDFLTAPYWSILARLRGAPAESLLPLSRRLGLGLPDNLSAKGLVSGAVGYSNRSGWNGAVVLENVTASVPDLPPFTAPSTTLSIVSDRIYVQPSLIESPAGSSLLVSGDYTPSSRALGIRLKVQRAPVTSLTATLDSWFGAAPVFGVFHSGIVTGELRYANSPPDDPSWSGEFQVSRASFDPPGLAAPVRDFSGRFELSGNELDVVRFSAKVAAEPVTGTYHYYAKGPRRERLRLQLQKLDLAAVDQLLAPTLGPQDFFSRFRFGPRSLPSWLAHRNIEADVSVGQLSIVGNELGPARAHIIWAGPVINGTAIRVDLPQGAIVASGSVNLSNVHPRYSVSGEASGLPYKGGFVDISGRLTSSGQGADVLANLRASGDFDGQDLEATDDVNFTSISGQYTFSVESGRPSLRLTGVSAQQLDETWHGAGASDKDGSLVLQLTSGTRQLRVSSSLRPEENPVKQQQEHN
jgi:AsmA protein